MVINAENLQRFLLVWEGHLLKNIAANPERYHYGIEQVPEVVARMREALEGDTYVHDQPATKATCKELGISNTYKAINNYLAGV